MLLAQQAAGQLPPPAAGWFAALTGKSQALVASGTKSALDDQYQQAVGKDCADFTRGRYPFSASSNNDIPLQNFGELFGYGGRFDSFYNQTAGKLIDASGRYWHWKTGPGAISGSAGMLAQLQGADTIKQMFFRSGNVPEVDFTLLTTFDYRGDWAFFRALQAASLQKQSDLRFVASFNFGGHMAKVTLQANNLKNPFLSNALSSFRCGG